MKKDIRLSSLLLVLFMSVFLLAGCGSNTDESESGLASLYSEGIDSNGFLKGIKALDYIEDVENLGYGGLTIPADAHEVTDEDLQYQIDTLMAGYIARIEITDRAIADGETVNIDYEGKIDGDVFEGGSTMSVGVDVIVEATDETEEDDTETLSFLDAFLAQLIGHKPGETMEIEVTFPDDYDEETLAGKDAVFETTINYIVEQEELTDEFVAENLSSTNGWTTIAEMKEDLRTEMKEDLIQQYIEQFLSTEVPVKSIPDSMMEYQEEVLLNGFQEMADYNGIELEAYLQEYEGFSSVEECIADAHDDLVGNATSLLVVQAVAEDAGISVTDEEMATYASEYLWGTDISTQEDYYGLPYVKQQVLGQKVIDYIAENAVLS